MSLYTDVMGKTPETKFISYFVSWSSYDICIQDLIDSEKLGRNRCYSLLKTYLELGVIIKSKKVGNVQMYKYNKDSKLARTLKAAWKGIVKNFPEHLLDKGYPKEKCRNDEHGGKE